jgi:hypothetical protein
MLENRKKRLRSFLLVGASVGAMGLPAASAASASASPGVSTVALSPTSNGWAVVGEDDAVLYEAAGPEARQRCLEQARELGALRIATRY